MAGAQRAYRARITGRVQGVGFRAATVARARELGVWGWARNEDDGSVAVHAEGLPEAVDALADFLRSGPPGARVEAAQFTTVKPEGHEQFAVRGVPAGRFVVVHETDGPGTVLWLELADGWRGWRLAKAPSMVPADKRFASELTPGGTPEPIDDSAGGTASNASDAQAAVSVGRPFVDAGLYEQGGRVAWPEAITRGHAVFVLHGAQLRGGFALQRTRGVGPGSGWLLIKRRDAFAAG